MELQLTMNGLRTTGIVHRDANGNDYFYYPGSAVRDRDDHKHAEPVGRPRHHSLRRAVHWPGEVPHAWTLPDPVTPSVGPFAAVSMKEGSRKLFPGDGRASATPSWADRVRRKVTCPAVPPDRSSTGSYDALGPAESGSQLA